MAPARNLLRRHFDSYGGGCLGDFHQDNKLESHDPTMAEDRSRTDADDPPAAVAGTSTSEPEADDTWLQLGIGRRGLLDDAAAAITASTSTLATRPPTELELFADRPSSSFRPPPFLPPMTTYTPQAMPVLPVHGVSYRQSVQPWGFWSPNPMMSAAPTPPAPPLQYSFRRYACPPGPAVADMRVVSPPRRPQAGVWFFLQAAQNQVKEPFLPQIPRTYLRIRDGRMTVRLLMKYLVRKLGLDDESEVEISCRGQLLFPFLTLQHVRDNIWCLRVAVEQLPDSSSPLDSLAADHVMVLQYGRSST